MKKLVPIFFSTVMTMFLFTGCFNARDNSMDTLPNSTSSTPSVSSEDSRNEDDSMSNSNSNSTSNSHSISGSHSTSNSNSTSGSHSGSMSATSPYNSNSNSTNSAGNSASNSASISSSLKASINLQPAIRVLANMQTEWNMVLVNAQNPLKEGFSVKLENVEGYENRQFDARAIDQLESMLKSAQDGGVQLYLVSAYRTPERQAALFEKKVASFEKEGFDRQEAEIQASQWVARPNTSEHNLGLAADLVSSNWYSNNDDLTKEFEDTEHFKWLMENCAEYGFILRYPKDKQHITGVTYEPWHFRYVGEESAKIIMENNLTLEEYVKA